MTVKAEDSMSLEELELHSIKQITKIRGVDTLIDSIQTVTVRTIHEITNCETSSCATVRSHLTPCWRTICTVSESALALSPLQEARKVFSLVTESMHNIKTALDNLIHSAGFDRTTRDTLQVYSGYNLAYTSIVRGGLESISAIVDPTLACDLLLGLESVLPMDNKGISNVYKKVSSVEDDSIRSILSDAQMYTPSFPEGEVQIDDVAKSFEKYWTMIDIARRTDPQLLTETKSWGKFSQSATATLQLLTELDSPGVGEPIDYEPKLTSFPVQLSSSSFKRRALFTILFTANYVVLNSTNALITAGAKNMVSAILKSLPSTLVNLTELLNKMENHWIAWKSSVHSKEVCGPFEMSSRIERGYIPFGDPWTEPVPLQPPTPVDHHTAIKTIESGFTTSSSTEFVSTESKMVEYRQYVVDAILCDISDESEVARLSANDAGFEEAMRKNNDRVLLWQFKRMRFNADLNTFGEKRREMEIVTE